MLRAKPMIIAPTLAHFVWLTAPEGAVRLWPGKAGSTAPREWIGCVRCLSRLLRQQVPRDWLCQTAGAATDRGGLIPPGTV